jgi:hypothetical protein
MTLNDEHLCFGASDCLKVLYENNCVLLLSLPTVIILCSRGCQCAFFLTRGGMVLQRIHWSDKAPWFADVHTLIGIFAMIAIGSDACLEADEDEIFINHCDQGVPAQTWAFV